MKLILAVLAALVLASPAQAATRAVQAYDTPSFQTVLNVGVSKAWIGRVTAAFAVAGATAASARTAVRRVRRIMP